MSRPTVFLVLLFAVLASVFDASAAAPVASVTPSRTTCTAPCAVYFDATATTDADTSNPFHDLDYVWSFGDGTAGNWTYGTRAGQSRNFGKGPTAAHVYETAGNYTWQLSVCDATACDIESGTITVAAANTTFATTATMCIANGSTPVAGSGGCPSGANVRNSSDFDASITACVTGATKRCLFKRGDSFTSSAISTITNDTVMIASYGTGAKPAITGTAPFIRLSGSGSSSMTEFWLLDLAINCGGAANAAAIDAVGSLNRMLMFGVDVTNCPFGARLDITQLNNISQTGSTTTTATTAIGNAVLTVASAANMAEGQKISVVMTPSGSTFTSTIAVGGISGLNITMSDVMSPEGAPSSATVKFWTNTASPTAPLWDQVFIVGNTFDGWTGGDGDGTSCTFASGKRFVYMDNYCNKLSSGEHGIRTSVTIGGVYSNNTMINVIRAGMSLRGRPFAGEPSIVASTYSGTAVVSDNKIIANSCGGNGGNNDTDAVRVRDWIWERNLCVALGADATSLITTNGSKTTWRNNVVVSTGTTVGGQIMYVDTSNATIPAPTEIWIYNNTGYRADAAAANSSLVLVSSGVDTVVVKNNLCYAPNEPVGTARCIVDSDGGITVSNNTTDGVQVNTSPEFASATPTNPIDFRIATTSYGNNAGTAVFPASNSDFFNCDDSTANERIGAFVPRTRATCRGVAGP